MFTRCQGSQTRSPARPACRPRDWILSSGFSIGGSNGRNNLITVDGGENEYGSGQARFDITPEAIQEFQVNRNSFTAEFGFTAGTAVNVITKSGSNSFHGSGYIYYRSEKTSARNFFDFTNPRAEDRQLFPGFTFGGPIKKNKLFFFTNFGSWARGCVNQPIGPSVLEAGRSERCR